MDGQAEAAHYEMGPGSSHSLQTGYVPPPQPAAVLPDSSQMGSTPHPPVVTAQPQQPDIMANKGATGLPMVSKSVLYLIWYPQAHTVEEKSTYWLIVSTILSAFYFACGCWLGLLCAVPAAVIAGLGLKNASNGNEQHSAELNTLSFYLNIAGGVTAVLLAILYLILIIATNV